MRRGSPDTAARLASVALLTTTAALNLNQAATTEFVFYTVPAGKTAIITKVVLRSVTGDPGTACVVTLGVPGGDCDEFAAAQLLTALDDSTKYVVIYPDQGTHQTPEGGVIHAAGTTFGMEIETDAGEAATVVADVFGYLY